MPSRLARWRCRRRCRGSGNRGGQPEALTRPARPGCGAACRGGGRGAGDLRRSPDLLPFGLSVCPQAACCCRDGPADRKSAQTPPHGTDPRVGDAVCRSCLEHVPPFLDRPILRQPDSVNRVGARCSAQVRWHGKPARQKRARGSDALFTRPAVPILVRPLPTDPQSLDSGSPLPDCRHLHGAAEGRTVMDDLEPVSGHGRIGDGIGT